MKNWTINDKKVVTTIRNDLMFRWDAILEDGSRVIVFTDKQAFKIQNHVK